MFRSNKPVRKLSAVDTVIGGQTEVRGRLGGTGDGIIRIEGRLDGEVCTEGDVVVAEGGEIVGDIQARDVVVGGRVRGNVSASGRLELLPTAHLIGDVHAGLLSIAEGAVFRGTCDSLSGEGTAEAADGGPVAAGAGNLETAAPAPGSGEA